MTETSYKKEKTLPEKKALNDKTKSAKVQGGQKQEVVGVFLVTFLLLIRSINLVHISRKLDLWYLSIQRCFFPFERIRNQFVAITTP